MALIGDVVIKFAADFAEFAAGMDETKKKLDSWGDSITKAGQSFDGFVSLVKRGVAALALEQLAESALSYAEALQKSTAALGTQALTLGLTTDQLQAYKLAAVEAGLNTDAVVTSVTRFNVAIGQATQGSKSHIDALNQLGVKILDANGKLRDQNTILAETARALLAVPAGAQRAALEVSLFGKAGQDLNVILASLSSGTDGLIAKFQAMGLIIDEQTIQKMEAAEKASALFQARIDALLAPVVADIKSTLLGATAAALQFISDVIAAFDLSKLQTIIAILAAPLAPGAIAGLLLGGGVSGAAAMKGAFGSADFDAATAAIKSNTDQLKVWQDVAKANPTGPIYDHALAQIDTFQKKVTEAQKAQADALSGKFVGTAPPVTVPGVSNPTPTGGSNAAAKEQENIENMIKRYADLQGAAQKTFDFIGTERGKSIEDLTREVKVQQTSDDIITKYEDKHGKITDDQRARLEANVLAYEKVKDAAAALLKVETDAAATEQRLGDGSAEYTKRLIELNKERDTGRVSTLAYNNALDEAKQKELDLADQSKRWANDFGSLAAGFDEAARSYAKSTDMFATGGQVFTGITTALTDSLDVLVGTSTKSFQQIALSFVQMLEKMALQAALSPVFKMISGGVTSLLGGATPFADVGSLIATLPLDFFKASGGPVGAGQPYVVGESGPELFVPRAAGTIVPAGAMQSQGGGVTVNVDMSGGSTQGTNDPTNAIAFGRKVKQAVVDTIQNEQRPGGTLYRRLTA